MRQNSTCIVYAELKIFKNAAIDNLELQASGSAHTVEPCLSNPPLTSSTEQPGIQGQKQAISSVATGWRCNITFSHSPVYPEFW